MLNIWCTDVLILNYWMLNIWCTSLLIINYWMFALIY